MPSAWWAITQIGNSPSMPESCKWKRNYLALVKSIFRDTFIHSCQTKKERFKGGIVSSHENSSHSMRAVVNAL